MNFHLERRRTLLWSRDEAIANRAEKLFSDAGVVTRQAALEEMRPALEMEGDPMWGVQTFQERCAPEPWTLFAIHQLSQPDEGRVGVYWRSRLYNRPPGA